jgi:hypothetical protein
MRLRVTRLQILRSSYQRQSNGMLYNGILLTYNGEPITYNQP